MARAVLDASAVMAVLEGEPGANAVQLYCPGSLVSAVNVAEVIAKMTDRGFTAEQAHLSIAVLELTVTPFDQNGAYRSGVLRNATRSYGLSLGDRACLSLAIAEALP